MDAAELRVVVAAEVAQAQRALRSLSQSLERVASDSERAADNSARSWERMAGRFSSAAAALRGPALALSGAFAAVAAGMGAVARQGVEMNTAITGARAGLTAITHSSREAERMIADLRREALSSIMTFKQMLPLAQQLAAAYGPEGIGRVIPTLRAFGDAAAALQASPDALERALLGFRQILARSTASQQDINQVLLNLPGLNLAPVLRRMFGSADTEALARGRVTGRQVADAIVTAMQEQFGGAQQKLMQTLPGVVSNLRDTWNDFVGTLTERFTPQVIAALRTVSEAFGRLMQNRSAVEAIQAGFNALGSALTTAARGAAWLIDRFTTLPDWMQRAVVVGGLLTTALTGAAGAGLLLASAASSCLASLVRLPATLAEVRVALGGVTVAEQSATAATTTLTTAVGAGGLAGALRALGPIAAAAFTGWGIGRLIDEVFGLSDAIGNVVLRSRGLPGLRGENIEGADVDPRIAAVQKLRALRGRQLQIGSKPVFDAAEAMAVERAARQLRIQLDNVNRVYDLTDQQLNALAGRISAEYHAQADLRRARPAQARPAGPPKLPAPTPSQAADAAAAVEQLTRLRVGAMREGLARTLAQIDADAAAERAAWRKRLAEGRATAAQVHEALALIERRRIRERGEAIAAAEQEAERNRRQASQSAIAETQRWLQARYAALQRGLTAYRVQLMRQGMAPEAVDLRAAEMEYQTLARLRQQVARLPASRAQSVAQDLAARTQEAELRVLELRRRAEEEAAARTRQLTEEQARADAERVRVLQQSADAEADAAARAALSAQNYDWALRILRGRVQVLEQERAQLGETVDDARRYAELTSRIRELNSQIADAMAAQTQHQRDLLAMREELRQRIEREAEGAPERTIPRWEYPTGNVDTEAQVQAQVQAAAAAATAQRLAEQRAAWQRYWRMIAEDGRRELSAIGVEFVRNVLAGVGSIGSALTRLFQRLRELLIDLVANVIVHQIERALGGIGKRGGVGGLIGSLLGSIPVIGGLFRAEGGPVPAWRSAVVGERGPEVVVPMRDSYVLPMRPAARVVNVSVVFSGDIHRDVDLAAGVDYLTRQIRRTLRTA